MREVRLKIACSGPLQQEKLEIVNLELNIPACLNFETWIGALLRGRGIRRSDAEIPVPNSRVSSAERPRRDREVHDNRLDKAGRR